MSQIQVNLPSHHQGDTWKGISSFGPYTVNGSAPASPLQQVRLFLTREGASVPSIKLGTGDGMDAPIVIHNAATWFGYVPKVPFATFNLAVGVYWGDLEFTSADGDRISPYRIRLEVTKDLTHD